MIDYQLIKVTQPYDLRTPRLRCVNDVPLTQASVEAPPRSEGYDRAEKL